MELTIGSVSIPIGNVAEVLAVAAEALVAWVIYLEFRQNRRAKLLHQVAMWEQRGQRALLYEEFWKVKDSSPEDRRAEFCKRIQSKPELRSACDDQIVYLSNVWYILRSVRGRWTKRNIDTWFPHVIVPFWIITGPYVLERQKIKGPWTGYALMDFTLLYISFLKKQTVFITLESPDRGNDIIVTRECLATLETEIRNNRRPSRRGLFHRRNRDAGSR